MAAGDGSSQVLCPKCKVPMVYMMETEKNSGGRRITRYYRCPACGTRVIVERLLIKVVDGRVKVYDALGRDQEIVYAKPQVKPKREKRRE